MSVSGHLLPALYAVFVWWASTGVILYLNGMPRWTHGWTMAGATVLLAVALAGVTVTAGDTRVTGAYLAFTCAVVIWGWQEVGFLLGYILGPRRVPCPPTATGWRRTLYALQALLYHEIALLALGACVFALTWEQPNTVARWTFAILWIMRLSAKLNVFLGVRNLNADFLPERLQYLVTYFTQRPMNRLFPWSVILTTLLCAALWHEAMVAGDRGHAAAAATFLATFATLALVEHWLLVLPLRSEALWQWGLRSRTSQAADS